MPRSILPSGIRKNNTQIIENGNGTICVVLHRTVIATLDASKRDVLLNTGGWNTPTTIRRMNECLHHWGFKCSVSKSDFIKSNTIIVDKNGGKIMSTFTYVIHDSDTIHGAGSTEDAAWADYHDTMMKAGIDPNTMEGIECSPCSPAVSAAVEQGSVCAWRMRAGVVVSRTEAQS